MKGREARGVPTNGPLSEAALERSKVPRPAPLDVVVSCVQQQQKQMHNCAFLFYDNSNSRMIEKEFEKNSF